MLKGRLLTAKSNPLGPPDIAMHDLKESACKTPRGNIRIGLGIIGPAGSPTAEVDTTHNLSSDRYGRRFLVNAWLTLQISS
jgi:hypothetical protein